MSREANMVMLILAIVAILFLVNSCQNTKKVEFKQKDAGDTTKTTLEVKKEY